MKFLEVAEENRRRCAPKAPRPKKQRRGITPEQVAEARAKLREEDQALANTLVVPSERGELVALAVSLRQAGTRKRSWREVAAILGRPETSIKSIVKNPVPRPTPNNLVYATPRPRREFAPPERPIHEEIRRLRGRRMTQHYLAEALGVDVALVRAWESGEARPTPGQYQALVAVLN